MTPSPKPTALRSKPPTTSNATSRPPAFRPECSRSIFHTAKDGFGSAEGDNPSDWIVFRVTAVTDPKLDANSPDAKRLDDVVQRQETNDISSSEYMAWLENDLGTSVNQTALAQAVGNGVPADTN